jgi:DNA mismatch repair protein MutL
MPIQLLPPEVASRIAAGEVIERPASVVKELIENSLDADAHDLRVEIADGGRRLIRVSDDGHGIPAAEVELAFARHATSKLHTVDDLEHIRTLGFRGEALASIAAVAQVTLLSRHRAETTGVQIRLEEGRVVQREAIGAPPGVTVVVEHLFHNLPARLKFLRPPASEAAYMQDLVTRYALANADRRFSFVNNGRLVFQSTGSRRCPGGPRQSLRRGGRPRHAGDPRPRNIMASPCAASSPRPACTAPTDRI